MIYLCAGFTTSTLAVEFSSEESVASHRDGAKADEGEGGEDEKAKHVGVGHGDHEEELDQVEDLVEGTLHAADHPSVLLLHLLLLDLKTFGGNFLDVRMTTIKNLADGKVCQPQTEPGRKAVKQAISSFTLLWCF